MEIKFYTFIWKATRPWTFINFYSFMQGKMFSSRLSDAIKCSNSCSTIATKLEFNSSFFYFHFRKWLLELAVDIKVSGKCSALKSSTKTSLKLPMLQASRQVFVTVVLVRATTAPSLRLSRCLIEIKKSQRVMRRFSLVTETGAYKALLWAFVEKFTSY